MSDATHKLLTTFKYFVNLKVFKQWISGAITIHP